MIKCIPFFIHAAGLLSPSSHRISSFNVQSFTEVLKKPNFKMSKTFERFLKKMNP